MLPFSLQREKLGMEKSKGKDDTLKIMQAVEEMGAPQALQGSPVTVR